MPDVDQQNPFSSEEKSGGSDYTSSLSRSMSPQIYELFVLGELMVQPIYSSILHLIAQRILGPWRPLSWGILSPLIRRLEQEGLITSVVEQPQEGNRRPGRGQPPRIYAITTAGRERFLTLMLTPSAYNRDTREMFVIKLSKLQFLAPAQQVDILAWYRTYLTDLCTYHQSEQSELLHAAYISEDERPGILQAIQFQLQTLEAELSWVERLMASSQAAEEEQ